MPNHHPELRTPAQQAVDSIEEFAGRYPGYRRAHAKGTCYSAIFTPNGKAAAFTTAPHLQNSEVPAIVRFSNSNPDPGMADLLSPAKGMAVQFQLPDQSVTNIVGVTIPVFFARTPESFIEIMKLAAAAKHKKLTFMEKAHAIIEHFSESKQALLEVGKLKPPASFGTAVYYSIHAFYFVNGNGTRQAVKYEWLPEAGVHTLSASEAESQGANYLEEEMQARTLQAPVRFTLNVVLGTDEDRTDDPTHMWPDSRERIEIGQLTIMDPVPEPDNLVMDPTQVVTGIELSDDPILNFRHEAYAISHHRRSSQE